MLYAGLPVPGHHHYTWYQKPLWIGVLAETTGTSAMPQCLTGTQYLTYKISLLTLLV